MLDKEKFDRLFNRVEAGEYISIKPGTLARWDSNKRFDLKPIKLGRSVRYRQSVLDKFLEERQKP